MIKLKSKITEIKSIREKFIKRKKSEKENNIKTEEENSTNFTE